MDILLVFDVDENTIHLLLSLSSGGFISHHVYISRLDVVLCVSNTYITLPLTAAFSQKRTLSVLVHLLLNIINY